MNKCEAVIEILQDDKIRNQLNPVTSHEDPVVAVHNEVNENHSEPDPQYDDEEEMLEMMAMQEECRLEMMKFYIQSQNPTLFEEIYHDVSYPDAIKNKQVPEEELRSPKVVDKDAKIKNESSSPDDEVKNNTLRDLVISELSADVAEFVPSKFDTNETESQQ